MFEMGQLPGLPLPYTDTLLVLSLSWGALEHIVEPMKCYACNKNRHYLSLLPSSHDGVDWQSPEFPRTPHNSPQQPEGTTTRAVVGLRILGDNMRLHIGNPSLLRTLDQACACLFLFTVVGVLVQQLCKSLSTHSTDGTH